MTFANLSHRAGNSRYGIARVVQGSRDAAATGDVARVVP